MTDREYMLEALALAREAAKVLPALRRAGLEETFAWQSYLFCCDVSSGLTSGLQLFCELLLEAAGGTFLGHRKVREGCIRKRVAFEFRQLGTHFVKDGKEYTVQKKDLCAQAHKANISFRP